ncbi:MAG: DUF3616 domain-containing protein [Blastocatellia bacterium]
MSNITNTLTFELKNDDELLENMSAVLYMGEHIFLASDEKKSIERVSKTDNNTYAKYETFKLKEIINLPFTGKGDEIDIEGLDYDGKYLWLVGSHSTKREKVKNKPPEGILTREENIKRLGTVRFSSNRYILARIPLVNGKLVKNDANLSLVASQLACDKVGGQLSTTSNDLIKELEKDDHIKEFLKIPSKDNGFDIEGLAVKNGKVFLGLRGPVLRGIAIIIELELEVDSQDPTLLRLKDLDNGKKYKKHFLDLNGLGVRDICIVENDFYILAGPTMTHDGLIGVFRWINGANALADSLDTPAFAFPVEHAKGKNRAEGLSLYSQENDNLSFLVVYNSPDETKRKGTDSIKADIISFTITS